jgi:ATP-dependent DNA ligase
MDGMRFNAIVKDGTCVFRSRNGKEVNLLGNLEKEFIALAKGYNIVFDGELVVLSEDGMSYLDRQTGNGILNKAVKGTITAKEAAQVSATLWDLIPYENFQNGFTNHAYKNRFAVLENMRLDSGKIRIVSNEIVADLEAARTLFERYLAEGQEGIILKDPLGSWENKRSRGQIKFKGELECDLRIVGIQYGTGKYEGMVGAYICESEDGVLKVDVGSGFKDHERVIDMSVIGKILAVKYNARIKNKQGKESLFLPIALEIREDKIIADMANKIA